LAETESGLQPVSNEPFARTITWRVFDETISPTHMARSTIFTGRAVSGPIETEVARRQFLSLGATINGRERDTRFEVTRAVLDRVTDKNTYETKTGEFVVRVILWGVVWMVTYALTWLALAANQYVGFIPAFIAICVVPPFFARGIIDFAWWSGHGSPNEFRARWWIATVLWMLALASLIVLQLRVG
jgi:hypothetical protein